MNRFTTALLACLLLWCALPAALRADDGTAAVSDPIPGLLSRILPSKGDAEKFTWNTLLKKADGHDKFVISCDGSTVTVQGTSNVAIATGINWYLQHYAGVDISWNSPTGQLPATLPAVSAEEHTASVDTRYYLNFCTHSYTMAFWDWARWEQEIDWMALHGINLPLIIQGFECVWREVLTDYGYPADDFLTGGAYYGWFFMNNMTAWGGPMPESWYAERKQLARNTFQRLNEYGMTPVVPGYVGMIPADFVTKAAKAGWAEDDVTSNGKWCGFTRPSFVYNAERLKEFAAKYYAKAEELFGDVMNTHYYAIDPFHEGGSVPSGLTLEGCVKTMWNALTAYDPQAVWVVQYWQDNPKSGLTTSLPKGRLLILNLHGDSHGQTTPECPHTSSDGQNHDWVWGHTSNFGGNVGLFGRLSRMISCFYTARDNNSGMVGVGTLPEGIENNDICYDLIYSLPWVTEQYTLQSWLKDYVKMRYGLEPGTDEYNTMLSAWTRLAEGPYNCPNDGQQGTTESVFMMRPNATPGTVSSWAGSTWYWDLEEVRTAAYEMLSLKDKLKDNDNYRYDLVDVVRQALADHGKETLDQISSATGSQRDALAQDFLEQILAQDRLLGTRREFRLGTWVEKARAHSAVASEQDTYEKNARMLITTWGDEAQCNGGGLHDYANREWNGLLSSYYYPRWKAYFDNGFQWQNWFPDYEFPFANGTQAAGYNYLPAGAPFAYGSFSSTPEGDEIEQAQAVFDKYFGDFEPLVWERVQPDFAKTYLMTSAKVWHTSFPAENSMGVNIAQPDADYSGYRMQHTPMAGNEKNTYFHWRFEASPSVDGAVRVKNVRLTADGKANYVTSTPSSQGYKAVTMSTTGDDYYLYTCRGMYYLQDANTGVYIVADLGSWSSNAACMLLGDGRNDGAYFHIYDEKEGIPEPVDAWQPDFSRTYYMTNVATWYESPDADGLTYDAGKEGGDWAMNRLKRTKLVRGNEAFYWQFEASKNTTNAVRVKNVALAEAGDTKGIYLSATPTGASYNSIQFSDEGDDFYIFEDEKNPGRFYLKPVNDAFFFAPDTKWEAACVQPGDALSSTSWLYIYPIDLATDLVAEVGPFLTTAKGELFGLSEAAATAMQPDYDKNKTNCGWLAYESLKKQLAEGIRYPEEGYYRIHHSARSEESHYVAWQQAREATTDYADRYPGLTAVAADDAPTQPGSVFELIPTDEQGSYYLCTQGCYVQPQASANQPFKLGNTPAPFRFDIQAPGKVAIGNDDSKMDNGHGGYWHEAGWNGVRSNGIVTWDADNESSYWRVEPADELLFTLRQTSDGKYYGTLYVDFPLAAPDGVHFFLITPDEANAVALINEVADAPARTGLLLYADKASSPVALRIPAAVSNKEERGSLKGFLVDTSVSGAFVFSQPDDSSVGFYPYVSTSPLPANKAFLELPADTEVKGFVLPDALTGLGSIATTNPATGQCYDLQGRRVRTPQRGGIYVVGGKKVIF